MQDKKLRDEYQRLYLDPKQLATSSQIMQKINPSLFDQRIGDTDKLLDDEALLDQECKNLGNLPLSKF